MARVRCCPHCKKKVPLDEGYTFDKDLNMVCSCGKTIFMVVDTPEEPQCDHCLPPACKKVLEYD